MHALRDISFEVNSNEVVGILGANGAGKSTLLNTISGLVPPNKGSIMFDDVDLLKLHPYEVVELGIVQIPEGRRLFPLLTVEENLFLGSHVKKARMQRKDSLEEVYSMMPRLKERRNQLAKTLSGGEQQMLAIGRGLMAKPKLLLMDEPTLGLAPILVADVFKMIKLISERGISIILSEQNVIKTLKVSTRSFVIENGIIILKGNGQELLDNEHIKKAYLGV